jgi:ornithine cyclodeaminase
LFDLTASDSRFEEFSALQYVRERVAETGFCEALDMIADPDDPRNLFGMLERAR